MMGAEGFGRDSLPEKQAGPSSYNNDPNGPKQGRLSSGAAAVGKMFENKIPKDRRQILEIGDDRMKLKEMRKVIEEMMTGVDLSDFFSSVVKNVACKSVELKKLTYQFVVRYAEEMPDIALLSIASFQKGLKDPNQLIRASALRVLSSIRVDAISPIMEIAVGQAAVDMSPYVRKCAAHALPKLYTLSPDLKDNLIDILEKLLHDRTSLVLGSVIMAFEEICPERYDLIHKHFRKLCNTLIDIDEWGQVTVLHMLTRYCRANFRDPNLAADIMGGNEVENFYGKDDDSEPSDVGEDDDVLGKGKFMMDPDHRLLLRSAIPLLQNRNSAVIMAVVHLYRYAAPTNELGVIAKPLVRMLRSSKEIQSIGLTIIATMVTDEKCRPTFIVYLKNFFVRSDDPQYIRTLKLETMCCLVTETNVGTVLREYQTYVRDDDKEFVCQTIQCLGRVASKVPIVTEQCLNGLMSLLTEDDESVVGESVVVIKKLLQINPEDHRDTIRMLSRLATTIAVPAARASILWLLGEYSGHVPKIAPDVLRQLAKTFCEEEDVVKLQILNLAAKLYLTNQKQTKILLLYVLQLGKYDVNYDIRDRSRYIRAILMTKDTKLHKHSKHLFLSKKPAPALVAHFTGHDRFALGTLSHVLDCEVSGYINPPAFPETPTDPTLRNVDDKSYDTTSAPASSLLDTSMGDTFYDSDDSGSDSDSGEEDSDDSDESKEDDSDGSASETDDESSEDSGNDTPVSVYGGSTTEESSSDSSGSDDSDSDSDDSDSDSDDSNSSDDDDDDDDDGGDGGEAVKPAAVSLLDLDFGSSPAAPVAGLGLPGDAAAVGGADELLGGVVLSPTMAVDDTPDDAISTDSAPTAPLKHELLNKVTGQGFGADYMFTRNASTVSAECASVMVTFTNTGPSPLTNVRVGETTVEDGAEIHAFEPIAQLLSGGTIDAIMNIKFGDAIRAVSFELCASEDGNDKTFKVSLEPTVGELLVKADLDSNAFDEEAGKLGGMNESSCDFEVESPETVDERVLALANLALVVTEDPSISRKYVGRTLEAKSLVLVTVAFADKKIVVNCENVVFASNLLKGLKTAL